MDLNGVLLADFGDVIRILVIIIIVGFSVIGKLLNTNGAGQPRHRNRPQRRPPPRPQQQPAQQSIEQEIEEFLSQARAGNQTASPPPSRPLVAESLPDTTEDEWIQPGREFGQSIANHVKEHIGSGVATRDAHLGETIETADERIEHHLEEVFEHEVGHLAHVDPVDNTVAEGTDADSYEKGGPTKRPIDIVEMLRSPDDIRKIFVLSEILKRPDV